MADNNNPRYSLNNRVVWGPPLLVFALFIFHLSLPYALTLIWPKSNDIKELINALYTGSAQSTEIGLAIIGVAVSVWIGLNIYNIVKRENFYELANEYKNLQSTNNDLQKSFKALSTNSSNLMESNDTIQKEQAAISSHIQMTIERTRDLFCQALQLSHADRMCEMLYNEFVHELANPERANEYDPYITLMTEVEQLFRLTYDTYEQGRRHQAARFSMQGTNAISRLKNRLEEAKVVKDAKLPELLQRYTKFREAEFLYYSGEIKGRLHSIKIYEKLFKTAETTYDENQDLINKAKAYYINTIGLIYDKVYRSMNEESEIEGIDTPEKALELANSWYEKFNELNPGEPAKSAKSSCVTTRYYRNWGVCLDNLEKRDEAVKVYDKALAVYDNESDEYKVFTTYVASILRKMDNDSHKGRYDEEGTWWQIDRVKSLCVNFADLETYLSFSKTMRSVFPDPYIQTIKLATYKLLLAATPEEKDVAKKEVLANEKILKIIDHKTGIHFVLRDYFAALFLSSGMQEDLKAAHDHNEQLKANKRNDVEAFTEYYKKVTGIA